MFTSGDEAQIISGNAFFADENGRIYLRAYEGAKIVVQYGCDAWYDPGQWDPRSENMNYTVTAFDFNHETNGRMTMILNDGSALTGTRITGTDGYWFGLKGMVTLTVPKGYVVTSGPEAQIISGNAFFADEDGRTYLRAYEGAVITVRYGCDAWYDSGQWGSRVITPELVSPFEPNLNGAVITSYEIDKTNNNIKITLVTPDGRQITFDGSGTFTIK